MRWTLWSSLLALALTALAAGCGTRDFEPPPRTASVRAEEDRVAAIIERHERDGFGSTPGRCSVRVLGSEGGSVFAWARCSFPPSSGVSTAYRVDGTTVRHPESGAGYSASIREMFPRDIADAVLEHPETLRPAER